MSDPVKYPPDMLANGGAPFDTYGLRSLTGPVEDYAAVALVFDVTWKVVAGEVNTVVAEGSLHDMLQYMFEFGWRIEDAARKANGS